MPSTDVLIRGFCSAGRTDKGLKGLIEELIASAQVVVVSQSLESYK